IRELLLRTEEQPTLDEEMAQLIAGGLRENTSPKDVARRLRARVDSERWSALARASEAELTEALAGAAEDFPRLRERDALRCSLEVQEALRGRDAAPVAVGWLVRAAGPGLRGQTLRIPAARCRVGRSTACEIKLLDDDRVEVEHASIALTGGEFVLTPVGA